MEERARGAERIGRKGWGVEQFRAGKVILAAVRREQKNREAGAAAVARRSLSLFSFSPGVANARLRVSLAPTEKQILRTRVRALSAALARSLPAERRTFASRSLATLRRSLVFFPCSFCSVLIALVRSFPYRWCSLDCQVFAARVGAIILLVFPDSFFLYDAEVEIARLTGAERS